MLHLYAMLPGLPTCAFVCYLTGVANVTPVCYVV